MTLHLIDGTYINLPEKKYNTNQIMKIIPSNPNVRRCLFLYISNCPFRNVLFQHCICFQVYDTVVCFMLFALSAVCGPIVTPITSACELQQNNSNAIVIEIITSDAYKITRSTNNFTYSRAIRIFISISR